MDVDSGLEGEGLEDVILDIFHIKVSKVDPVREEVHIGIEPV